MGKPDHLVEIPHHAVTAARCLHPGCTRKVVAGALCGYHGNVPPGMTPVPTDAFRKPFGHPPPVPKKAAKPPAKRKRRPSTAKPPTGMERLEHATALLLGAARDYMVGKPGAWERVESARSAVAGAALGLHEWEGRPAE